MKCEQRNSHGRVGRKHLSGRASYNASNSLNACCCNPCWCKPDKSAAYPETMTLMIDDMNIPTGCNKIAVSCQVLDPNSTDFVKFCDYAEQFGTWQVDSVHLNGGTFCLKNAKQFYAYGYDCWWVAETTGNLHGYFVSLINQVCSGTGILPFCSETKIWIGVYSTWDNVIGGQVAIVIGFGSIPTTFPQFHSCSYKIGYPDFNLFDPNNICLTAYAPPILCATGFHPFDCNSTITITDNTSLWYNNQVWTACYCPEPYCSVVGDGINVVYTPPLGHAIDGTFILSNSLTDPPCT